MSTCMHTMHSVQTMTVELYTLSHPSIGEDGEPHTAQYQKHAEEGPHILHLLRLVLSSVPLLHQVQSAQPSQVQLVPHGARDPVGLFPRSGLAEDSDDLLDGVVLGALGLDHKPVLEESVQNECGTQAYDTDLGLYGDTHFHSGLAVLWHVDDDNTDVECPVPPVEEGAIVDVRCTLKLIHPERDHSGSEADVGHTEQHEYGRHYEELIEDVESVVDCLQREEYSHDGEAQPADPETEANHVVLPEVGVSEVAGDGEHDLRHSVDHQVSGEDELGADDQLQDLRRDAIEGRREERVDEEHQNEGLAGEEIAMVPLAAEFPPRGVQRLVAAVQPVVHGRGADYR